MFSSDLASTASRTSLGSVQVLRVEQKPVRSFCGAGPNSRGRGGPEVRWGRCLHPLNELRLRAQEPAAGCGRVPSRKRTGPFPMSRPGGRFFLFTAFPSYCHVSSLCKSLPSRLKDGIMIAVVWVGTEGGVSRYVPPDYWHRSRSARNPAKTLAVSNNLTYTPPDNQPGVSNAWKTSHATWHV